MTWDFSPPRERPSCPARCQAFWPTSDRWAIQTIPPTTGLDLIHFGVSKFQISGFRVSKGSRHPKAPGIQPNKSKERQFYRIPNRHQ